MNTRFSLAFAALTAFGLAAAHPAAAQSTIALQNGVFASAGNSNDVYDFTSNMGSGAPMYTFGNHPQGNTSGIYINGGSVYQFLGITGAAGETITLNGLAGNNPDQTAPAASELEFTTAAPTSADALASSSVLASEAITGPATSNDYVNFAPLTFTTTMANQSIYLVIGGPAEGTGKQSNFQNFSLTDTPAAVPEASTTVSFGLLLALGLSSFGAAIRKKKAPATV